MLRFAWVALLCCAVLEASELPELRVAADLLNVAIGENDATPVPSAEEVDAIVAACYCDKRASIGRPCNSKSEEAIKDISDTASKGCSEELFGMPDGDFKKKATHDCICRVKESAGHPCRSEEDETRRAEEEEAMKAECVKQQEVVAAEPLIAAKEQKECLCNWAKKVVPTLCSEDAQLEAIRSDVRNSQSACQDKATEDKAECICNERASSDSPCVDAKEWDKLQAAVLAKHATCGKINRRRRDSPASRKQEQEALDESLAQEAPPAESEEAPPAESEEAPPAESASESAESAGEPEAQVEL